jgi:hypothetical protein
LATSNAPWARAWRARVRGTLTRFQFPRARGEPETHTARVQTSAPTQAPIRAPGAPPRPCRTWLSPGIRQDCCVTRSLAGAQPGKTHVLPSRASRLRQIALPRRTARQQGVCPGAAGRISLSNFVAVCRATEAASGTAGPPFLSTTYLHIMRHSATQPEFCPVRWVMDAPLPTPAIT